jgi:hypothetical protein
MENHKQYDFRYGCENFNVWHQFLLSRNKVVVGEPAAEE